MCYALTSADGRLAIMQLSEGANIEVEVMKFASTNWMPDSVTPIDLSAIPLDRSERGSWAISGSTIKASA